MSYSDWQWVPDFGMYFSQTGNVYAKPDPGTGQWIYQSAGETSAAGAAAAAATAETAVVGWAMLAEDGGNSTKGNPTRREPSNPVTTTASTDLDRPDEREATTPIAILRLVALTSKVLSPGERIAVIDTRDDGFILGRDKTHRPRIRLKEMQVSKVHATVFWGDGKGSLDDEEGEEGFWLVDNGGPGQEGSAVDGEADEGPPSTPQAPPTAPFFSTQSRRSTRIACPSRSAPPALVGYTTCLASLSAQRPLNATSTPRGHATIAR